MHTVESNFREIYHSLKYQGGLQFPLVANLSGTRIYDSRYCWGRMWHCFYRLAEWITGSRHIQETALKSAVLHTHTLFQRELEKIQLSLKNYLDYLNICAKGYAVHERAFFPARSLLTKWNDSTKPFLKLINHKDRTPPLFELLTHSPIPLSDSSTTNNLRLCQKIIDLEGATGGPLPLAIIKKIIREIPLNAIDQKALYKWIDKIDTQKIKIQTIHKALQALSHIYAKKTAAEKSQQELTSHLELFLENYGCKIFGKNDEKHLEWRQRLEKGQKILINDSEMILGAEIFPDITGSDNNRAYAIEGRTDRIARIAHNRAIFPLRDLRMRKESHTGIMPVLATDISADGRIAIFERLKALNTIQWSSNENEISPEDTPMVNVLADLVKVYIKQDFTPANFSSKSLMLNAHMQVNFVNPQSKGSFNFNAIEDFFYECAAGNPIIFRELMVRSGMTEHPTAKFYRDIVANTLGGDNTAPDDLAGIYKISDPKVVDQAFALTGKIKKMKKKLVMQLRVQSPEKHPDQLEQQAKEILLSEYVQRKSAGTFRDNEFYLGKDTYCSLTTALA